MIVFDLRCENAHVFEAWFDSAAAYEDQRQRGLVECPLCASRHTEKAVMAPAIGAKGNQQSADSKRKAQLRHLAELQRQVEASCDYVGGNFAAEARRLHQQRESAKSGRGGERGGGRGIFGEASAREVSELAEEGIAVQPLPFRPRQTADA